MTELQIQQIINTMMSIGGTVAQEGFAIAMKYVIATATSRILWSVGLAVLAGITTRLLIKYTKEHDASERYRNDFEIWGTFAWLGVVGFALWSLSLLSSAIMLFIVPEWYAIESIMSLVSGG